SLAWWDKGLGSEDGRRLGRYRELPRATRQNAPNYDCCLASSRAYHPGPADGRFRRIHVIAAHSGDVPFIRRFADLCQRDGIDFRLLLAPTEYSADLTLA